MCNLLRKELRLGVLVYIASNLLACRLGERNFSRVDL